MNTPRSANTRNLVAACAAITVFGFAFGMTYPLLSLILESRGVASDMIGINSAMMPIGILLFSSMIPIAARLSQFMPVYFRRVSVPDHC